MVGLDAGVTKLASLLDGTVFEPVNSFQKNQKKLARLQRQLSRKVKSLELWYAEQGCDFCGWQLYERGELVDVLWGELEWSRPTDDELPDVTGSAWIVNNVAHYGG